MKHLLHNDTHWDLFVDNIEILFDKYENIDKSTMGFPEDWYTILKR